MRLRFCFFVLSCLPVLPATGQQSQGANPAREMLFVPPKRWAMVIGASNYQEYGRLRYAAGDAKSFAQTLMERFRYESQTVELITDLEGSAKKPDATTITAALDRQIADRRLNKGDLFIFYFAGHGIGTPQGDMLLPTDATKENAARVGLPVKSIVERFVKAGLRNVLIIADACRAGEKNEFGAELVALGRKANIAVLLGCAPGGRSYEYPRLGHGAFTNFLIRALKNPELCNPLSGALWASRIGEETERQVHDYTVRDYPASPQKPAVYAEKNQDVLMGSFTPRMNVTLATKAFQDEAKQMSGDKYTSLLDLYATDLFIQNRFAPALELFETLDRLGELPPFSRYTMGICMELLGRHGDMERQFSRLATQDESPLMRDISIMMNPSRRITPAQRLSAARNAWRASPEPWVGYLAWAALQTYGSRADSNSFLAEFLRSPNLDARSRKFIEGYRAGNAGDWNLALTSWKAAEGLPGEMPQPWVIRMSRFTALVSLGKVDEMVALVRQADPSDPYGGSWLLLLANYYRETDRRDLVVPLVKEALTKKLDPDDLLTCLQLVGMKYPEIADAVAAKAEEFPYAWKAEVAKTWTKALKQGREAFDKSMLEAVKYCDDEFAVVFEYLRILDVQLDELFDMGKLDPSLYLQLEFAYAATMAQNVDKFGYDSPVWLLFNKFSLMSERYQQLFALYELKLGSLVDQGTLDPLLRAPYMMAALSIGDERRIEQLWKLQGFHPADIKDMGWTRTMYLAFSGQIGRARAVLPKTSPSPIFQPNVKAFLGYLNVAEGKKTDLDALAKSLKDNPTAMQILGMAYAKKGDWKKAEPLLQRYCFERQILFTFIQARTVQTYFDRLIATRRFAEANNVAYTVMTSSHGNPLYRKIHFGASPNIASYAGTVRFDAAAFDLLPNVSQGQVTLSVDNKGVAKVEGKIGTDVLTGTGKVDAYGYVTVRVKLGKKVWTLTGKMAQPALYRKLPQFASTGQIFLLLDSAGQSLYVIGKLPAR